MILDGLLAFSSLAGGGTGNGDVITVTGVSTNQIDLHLTGGGLPVLSNNQGARDIGIGDDPALKLLVQVGTTFTAGGGATLTIALQGATDNGSGQANAFSTWWTSPAYALASLVAGARLLDMDMPRPPAGIAIPRFLQLSYTVATGPMTAGMLRAFIVLDRHDLPYNSTVNSTLGGYPPGITIVN